MKLVLHGFHLRWSITKKLISKIKVAWVIFEQFMLIFHEWVQNFNIEFSTSINEYFETNEYWFWGSEKDVDVKMFFTKGRLLRWSIIKDLVSTIIILSKFLLHWNVEHFIVYCLEFSKFWNWTSTKNFISNAVYVFQC